MIYLFIDGKNDKIGNGIFNTNIYWAINNNKTQSLISKYIISSSSSILNINIIDSSIINIPAVIISNNENFTFIAGINTALLFKSSSFNIPTLLTLQFKQCINKKCSYFEPIYFNYTL